MFRQMMKRRKNIEDARKGSPLEGEKSPAVIAIGIGTKPKGGIDPGAGADALAGDEDALHCDPKEAAILADHHQKLADEYRAKAAGAESPEEEAAESPEFEAGEDEGGEFHLGEAPMHEDTSIEGDDELDDGLGDEMFSPKKPFQSKKFPPKGKPY